MKTKTREQYELACRIDRMWARRRMDSRTARRLLGVMPVPVVVSAMMSFPAPAPLWRSEARWIRFLDIKAHQKARALPSYAIFQRYVNSQGGA